MYIILSYNLKISSNLYFINAYVSVHICETCSSNKTFRISVDFAVNLTVE